MTHPDDQPGRFGQCTETCTADCGHCKGRPVEALRAAIKATERHWAHARVAAERAVTERDALAARLERAEKVVVAAQGWLAHRRSPDAFLREPRAELIRLADAVDAYQATELTP